ncbi:hypothetical protein [Paenibacillus sp. GCM10012303]|uniref:hypothetical protein n=1 Tax=Paenibacillus sp. GCM10012303 TaxID=3317340 RepID=UPI003618E8BC
MATIFAVLHTMIKLIECFQRFLCDRLASIAELEHVQPDMADGRDDRRAAQPVSPAQATRKGIE